MMETVSKQEHTISLEQSEALAAELLALLERYRVLETSPVAAPQAESIKISLRRREDVARVKLKIGTAVALPYDHQREHSDLGDPKLKYGKLKKMMKRSFAALSRELLEEKIPTRALVDNFLAQSARMVTYGGRGDEHYARYSDACFALEQACTDADLARTRQALERIRQIKIDCHERHK